MLPAGARSECAPPNDAPPVCLLGTVTASGYEAAVVEPPGVAPTLTVKAGDMIADWGVAEIGAGYIVLAHSGTTERLDLVADAPAPRAAPAKPRPPIGWQPRVSGLPGGSDAYAK